MRGKVAVMKADAGKMTRGARLYLIMVPWDMASLLHFQYRLIAPYMPDVFAMRPIVNSRRTISGLFPFPPTARRNPRPSPIRRASPLPFPTYLLTCSARFAMPAGGLLRIERNRLSDARSDNSDCR